MSNSIDCKIFNFSKWVLPKTRSFNDIDLDSITIGYFDFVDIENIIIDRKNPFESYIKYKNKRERKYFDETFKNNSISYFDGINDTRLNLNGQQFFAFTNVGTENIDEAIYDFEKVKSFWEEKSLIRFYSLLHIENSKSKDNIIDIIKEIHDEFNNYTNGNSYSSVCYFSLDYSDIIICTKDISINEFSEKIFELNFKSSKKIIRDSFTLLSIDRNASSKISTILFNNYKYNSIQIEDVKSLIISELNKAKYKTDYINNQFVAAFNIGVQNYNTFNYLLDYLDKLPINYIKYKLLGRHDISLYSEKADLIWLIIVQSLIDYFSTESTNDSIILNRKNVLFNCESFIRIPFKENEHYHDSITLPEKFSVYDNAKKDMDERILVYKSLIDNINSIKPEHINSIFTLRNSILGLLKNGFADDFVLCIYESFLNFLDYINIKLRNDYEHDEQFVRCFNNYFDIINALINSAMHSDRQFIQSPSFNPVFYDVPPKLMAYYTALTHMINDIIKTPGDEKNTYSFVFRPSFDDTINIKGYSYKEAPPTSRLLAVTINEGDLYYPWSVISQLCHEVAHYVGDDNRNRAMRIYCFVQIILFDIAYNYIKDIVENVIDEKHITLWINNIMSLLIKEDFFKNKILYSYYFENFIYEVLAFINDNAQVEDFSRQMFITSTNLSQFGIEYASNQFHNYMIRRMLSISNQSLKTNYNPIEIFSTVFSEIYADLQMVLILGLSLDDYLLMFKKSLDNKTCIRSYNKIYYRILNIILLFVLNGTWDVPSPESCKYVQESVLFEDVKAYIEYFQPTKNKSIEDFKSKYKNNDLDCVLEKLYKYKQDGWQNANYWNLNIQRYLISAYNSSVELYKTPEKLKLINALKSNIKVLKRFDNAVDVFYIIQSTNEKYSEKIYHIDE